MALDISMHGVASVRIDPISDFPDHKDELGPNPFASRRITVQFENGTKQVLTLFAPRGQNLEPSFAAGSRPVVECGHRACRQSWIETGGAECVDGQVELTAADRNQAQEAANRG